MRACVEIGYREAPMLCGSTYMSLRNLIVSWAAGAVLLGACSANNAPPPQDPVVTAKAQLEAKASKQLALYEQMRSSGSIDLAASLGNEIESKYPGTRAATEVQKTLADVRTRAAQKAETQRLARLWAYNAVPEGGGTQYTGAIESKQGLKPGSDKKPRRIRLVLRQHPKWGQSVYLLLDNATFDCRKGCATLPVSFDDGKPERMKATIPPTGEPALFIDDDKTFIAKLEKSKTVSIGVNIKDEGELTEVFEVGGYDAAKLPNKPKK
jgi:hypothetical protein